MTPVTQIKIYLKMEKLKAQFTPFKDGGFTWEEFAYIGLLESKNRFKFGRENELYELVKNMKELD